MVAIKAYGGLVLSSTGCGAPSLFALSWLAMVHERGWTGLWRSARAAYHALSRLIAALVACQTKSVPLAGHTRPSSTQTEGRWLYVRLYQRPQCVAVTMLLFPHNIFGQ